MNYQTMYLIKRVLSSVATTLVYVAIDNVFYNMNKTSYRHKPNKKEQDYYRRKDKLESEAYGRKASAYMRKQF